MFTTQDVHRSLQPNAAIFIVTEGNHKLGWHGDTLALFTLHNKSNINFDSP